MKVKVSTPHAPQAVGPYSQAIAFGNLLFTSGQIHLSADGKMVEGTIEEQTHQVMKNIKAILDTAHTSFKDVLKTTIYVTDMTNYKKVNEVYASYMVEPFPARETVCVKELPLACKVEISMIAAKPI
jgi:2-iminobutanoate/2-iminopropanoate deaminase